MSEADDSRSTPDPPRAAPTIGIGGDAAGPVVAGDHNVVIDAQHGSRVHVVVGPERPRPRRRPRVALLPRSLPEPVGRQDVTRAVAAAVRAGGPVQLWGPPGIGKTTLLRHLARALPPGPDGVVFLNAARRDVVDLGQELFEACYEAPGYAPPRTELRRLMAELRVVVYLDDAGLTGDQLLELMDAAPAATFVLAADERSLWGTGTALRLPGLSEAAGLELLSRELGGALSEPERDAAVALCRAASGLPLPLLWAAAVARADPAGGPRLPRPGEVAALLPRLLDQLAEDAAASGALHLLAALPGAELAPAHVGALAEVADAEELCDRLARLGLARVGEHGYGAVADTVPAVRQRFPAPFPVERLCDHFARWASLPATTPAELAAHGPVLEKVAELAESAGRPDLAVRLARATAPGLARSLRLGAWGRLLGRGWTAARAAGDRRAEGYFLHEEAVRALLLGRRVVYAALLAQSAWLGYELGAVDGGAVADAGGGAGGPAVDAGGPPGGPAGPPGGADPGAPDASGAAGGSGAGAPDASGAAGGADPGAPDAPGAGAPPDAGEAPPDFDVERYMAENGFGPADPGAPAPDPLEGAGGDGGWGEVPADGGAQAPAGDAGASGGASPTPSEGADLAAAPPDGAASAPWGGGAASPSGGAGSPSGAAATSSGGAGGTAGAAGAGGGTASGVSAAGASGISAVAVSVASLVVGCALLLGVGYAVSTSGNDDERPASEDALADAAPTPTFSFPTDLPTDLPEDLTETSDELDLSNPPGCDERGEARSAHSERMTDAPLTNPGHDEAWAASTRRLAEDLAAAAELATDPAIKAAIQEESTGEAAYADAITRGDLTAMEQHRVEVYDAGGVVIDLCY